MDFAIIETGGKQYRVSPGQKIKTEELKTAGGDKIVFDKVLLLGGNGSSPFGDTDALSDFISK